MPCTESHKTMRIFYLNTSFRASIILCHLTSGLDQTRRAKYTRQRVERVKDAAANVQRCAADALGRAMPPLLDACYHR